MPPLRSFATEESPCRARCAGRRPSFRRRRRAPPRHPRLSSTPSLALGASRTIPRWEPTAASGTPTRATVTSADSTPGMGLSPTIRHRHPCRGRTGAGRLDLDCATGHEQAGARRSRIRVVGGVRPAERGSEATSACSGGRRHYPQLSTPLNRVHSQLRSSEGAADLTHRTSRSNLGARPTPCATDPT